MGEGSAYEVERKLRVAEPDLRRLEDAAASVSRIAQTYLTSPVGDAERVRRRELTDERGTRVQLTRTSKRHVAAGVNDEDEREIDEQEYAELLGRADPERVTIEKTRWVVPWAGRDLEIDRFDVPHRFWLLEVELPGPEHLHDELDLPDWLEVLEEVTGDPSWSNAALALRRPAG
jgi:CYTH domain-containing protein